jgi:3',5'-cyclic AMP phosphodiesterase CpdA
MRFLHFSDLHLWRWGLGGDFHFKRLIGLANLALRRSRQFPRELQERVRDRLLAEEADAVFFSGDLTQTSLGSEFDLGRQLLQPLFDKWGESFIAIPGNHDRYTPAAATAGWFEKLFLQNHQDYPFVHLLSDELSVVGIDCSRPRPISCRGRFTEQQAQQLEQTLETEAATGRAVIVVGHYPFSFPPGVHSRWSRQLHGDRRLKEIVDRPSVIAYLHGHRHRRWALRLNTVVCLDSGSSGKTDPRQDCHPGFLRFAVENKQVTEITAFSLKPRAFEEWTEEPLSPIKLA